jgi:putative aminopeptidase FrvX
MPRAKAGVVLSSPASPKPALGPKPSAKSVSRWPSDAARAQHLQWLLDLTQLPTVAGHEQHVIAWITSWVHARPTLELKRDRAGNLVIQPRKPWGKGSRRALAKAAPIFITAHLDHPAFVVERLVSPGIVELSFRGGVSDAYFQRAKVVIHAGQQRSLGTLIGSGDGVAAHDGSRLFPTYLCELEHDDAESDSAPEPDHQPSISLGDIATWALPPAEIDASGIVHTHACDDLAALAAALSAYDVLLGQAQDNQGTEDVRLLFTRSEEIGFTGAIAACKLRTMPRNARVIALENSRAFAESPVGGGPIVRVGDRMSIFDPRLTAACAKRAEQIAGHAAMPSATQTARDMQGWKWQRKLMAGGACEATVFCAYGYSATCLCLPLGNYHNMGKLAEVQAGTYDVARNGPPPMEREFIHSSDYAGLVDLLVAIGQDLPEADPVLERIEKLYDRTKSVIADDPAGRVKRARTFGSSSASAKAKSGATKPASKRRTAKPRASRRA